MCVVTDIHITARNVYTLSTRFQFRLHAVPNGTCFVGRARARAKKRKSDKQNNQRRTPNRGSQTVSELLFHNRQTHWLSHCWIYSIFRQRCYSRCKLKYHYCCDCLYSLFTARVRPPATRPQSICCFCHAFAFRWDESGDALDSNAITE